MSPSTLQADSPVAGPGIGPPAARRSGIVAGTALYMGGAAIMSLLTIATHALVSNLYGIAAYGAFSYGSSVLTLSQGLTTGGLGTAILKYAPMGRSRLFTSVSLSVSLAVAGLVVFAGTRESILSILVHDALIRHVVRILLLAVPAFTVLSVASCVVRASGMLVRQQIVIVLQQASFSVSACLAFAERWSLDTTLWGMVAASYVGAGLSLLVMAARNPDLRTAGPGAPSELRSFAAYAATTSVPSFAYALLTRTDRIIVGAFLDARGVALYNAAAVLAAPVSFVPSGVQNAYGPLLAHDANLPGEKKESGLASVTAMSVGLTALASSVMFLGAGPLFAIFGRDFRNAGLLCGSLASASVVLALGLPASIYLTLKGREKTEVGNVIVHVLLALILGAAGASWAGVGGLAASVVVASGVVSLIRYRQVARSFSAPAVIRLSTLGLVSTAAATGLLASLLQRTTHAVWIKGALALPQFAIGALLLMKIIQTSTQIPPVFRRLAFAGLFTNSGEEHVD